jgi:DNA-binding NarL/FixJ family response regulator
MEGNFNKENIHGTRIILVDDNQSFRSALKKLLEIQYFFKVIAEASNGDEFLNLTCHADADIVIMDLMMPGTDGQFATKMISLHYPSLKIIAVTMHCDKAYITELIPNGFKGCVFKNNLYDNILDAIVVVLNGGFYFPGELKKSIIPKK